MDVKESEAHTAHDDPPPALGKRLPRKAQSTLLGFVVALIVAAFVEGPAALHMLGIDAPAAKPEEAAADTTAAPGQPFKVTDRQWAALKIQPVEEHIFQDASETDGKIAID